MLTRSLAFCSAGKMVGSSALPNVFMGSSASLGRGNGTRVNALFKGGTKQLKKAAQQPKKAASKAASPLKKAVPKSSVGTKRIGKRSGGGSGSGDALWLPNTERPSWLDGSLPGDRGFDPLGLAKPTEYLQIDLDALDQNKAVNKAGQVLGGFAKSKANQISDTALQPYDEVFGLQRFRETELIHGRWAMLATLGVIVAEASTGVSWVDAGKVELDGARYLNFNLPFSISQLVWIEAILVGGAEIYRNRELDPEARIYPGGYFDPLNLASEDANRAFKLKEAELKHGRLAMVAFLGFGVQALTTGEGALGSLAKFASTFAPELVEDIEQAVGAA
ncbi:Chlorophyll a-b binding protein CP29.1, chloroplastic [Coccomyxa viridis]|uniref:Chlorophyll a-b binding protein, chloroplastic n=1 Tax=Coccomyxa viridis TaxID=1274662 RepID=A0AAV1IE56_9CHLO|nr:Chlorophyll a-b binding protein CP29.1, chloroplastic [Coccomyxa viridis]